jgi:uncharacterized membrane protein YbhN (UPF0104 family)
MWAFLRRCWPVGKALLTVAILVGVGWQFWRILHDPHLQEADPLHRPPLQILTDTLVNANPVWLVASGLLYLLGLTFSLTFWVRLLRVLGERPQVPAMTRAYFIGHIGKYVPGKAWSLLLRTTLASGPGVRPAVAAMTAVYETLTTMTAGAILAAALLLWQTILRWRDGQTADTHVSIGAALGLLALAGIPILPGVFNRLVRRAAAPFLRADAQPLPPVRIRTLLGGLALTACGWVLLGISLWCVLQGLGPEPAGWDVSLLGSCIAALAVAWVAGFVALMTPGGLGVRELILQQFLAPLLGDLHSLIAVLLLRLLWTAAEVIMAAIVYWLPGQREKPPAAE